MSSATAEKVSYRRKEQMQHCNKLSAELCDTLLFLMNPDFVFRGWTITHPSDFQMTSLSTALYSEFLGLLRISQRETLQGICNFLSAIWEPGWHSSGQVIRALTDPRVDTSFSYRECLQRIEYQNAMGPVWPGVLAVSTFITSGEVTVYSPSITLHKETWQLWITSYNLLGVFRRGRGPDSTRFQGGESLRYCL